MTMKPHSQAVVVAEASDRIFDDEYLTTFFRLKKDKIAAIETFLSNVDDMNAFFILIGSLSIHNTIYFLQGVLP
jgi:hypothetical protein